MLKRSEPPKNRANAVAPYIPALNDGVLRRIPINDWVVRTGGGKLNRYEVTHAGRASLKRMVHEYAEAQKAHGFSEEASPFQEQHREWGERSVA